MGKIRLILVGYFFTIIALFFYSYTQVDLGLTLSRASIFQSIEKSFQYVGYFQRPLSTILFIFILLALFFFYIIFIWLAIKKKLSQRIIWFIVVATTLLLTFSYNAFSYDLFNYIFDAKIITAYHVNPYFHKALDFPNDPMLGFMHWTQRTYVYGPGWLALTVPLSFIGFQFFLPTFFLFKILIAAFFLGTVHFLSKLLKEFFPNQQQIGTVLFALNPLIIIESLVSSHNDIVMMFFVILGLFLFLQKKNVVAIFAIVVSVLVKQATIFLLIPSVLFGVANIILKKKFVFPFKMFIFISSIFTGAGFIFVLQQRELQPWYFVWLLPFFSMFPINKYSISLVAGISLGLLLRYVPFLYLGNWDGIAIPIRNSVTIITPLLFVGTVFLYTFFFTKRKSK